MGGNLAPREGSLYRMAVVANFLNIVPLFDFSRLR